MRRNRKQRSVYVVYPAALFDGWEVVKEQGGMPVRFQTREAATAYANARGVMDGGGIVKLENWFGDTECIWELPSPSEANHSATPLS